MKFRLFFLLLVFALPNVYSQSINDGLIAYYSFSGNANDNIGSNDGIVYGATLATDRFGNQNSAYYFDGQNDWIEIADNDLLDFPADQDFTITLWANIAENQNDMRGNNHDLISKWNAFTSQGYPYAIRILNETANSPNRFATWRFDSDYCGNGPYKFSECEFKRDKWHQFVFRKNGDQLTIFQDGVKVGSFIDNTTLACNTVNNQPIYIGKREFDNRLFTGLIDDIAFYNRALSNTEIKITLSEGEWDPGYGATNFSRFSIPQQIEPAEIDSIQNTVNIKVSCGTDLTNVIPEFEVYNSVVKLNGMEQVSGGSVVDLSSQREYIINAFTESGCIEERWMVNVTEETVDQQELINKTNISSFTIPGQIGETIIDEQSSEINIVVPCNMDLNSLNASFELSEGAIGYHLDRELTNTELSEQSFEAPFIIQVFDERKCVSREWTVTVNNEIVDPAEVLTPDNRKYFIPNVFTPNNDGFNEFFEIGEYLQGSQLTIVNNKGKVVYQSDEYYNTFDGAGLHNGIYYYVIRSSCFEKALEGYIVIAFKNSGR